MKQSKKQIRARVAEALISSYGFGFFDSLCAEVGLSECPSRSLQEWWLRRITGKCIMLRADSHEIDALIRVEGMAWLKRWGAAKLGTPLTAAEFARWLEEKADHPNP